MSELYFSQNYNDNYHCTSLNTTAMNEGPDAITAAAAISVLMAPHDLIP
jgi:hypothetical protein